MTRFFDKPQFKLAKLQVGQGFRDEQRPSLNQKKEILR